MQPLPYSDSCFVCGHDNPLGLKLHFFRDEDEVVSRFELPSEYSGFLDRTHGGIVSSLLDEAMGWATAIRWNCFTYTVELKVRFRQPVPVEAPLQVRARISRHTRRLSFAEARIPMADGILATAEGKFMRLDRDESDTVAGQLIYDPGAWRFE